ncbi:MAG: hypothetical protein ACLQK4_04545 [Acidimicrobiales bacterium]
MVWLVAIVLGAGFGAGDQYLGSINAPGLWTVSLSLLSAPWLVLPFGFGCSQLRSNRAAAVGLVVTLSALFGYFLMIMGPFEGGHSSLTLRHVHGLLVSNKLNIAGGLVTGPLYGFLGQRWRTRRAWMSAVLVAGALCLEPFAEMAMGNDYSGASIVWPAEVVTGIATAAYFLGTGIAHRRRGERATA